MSVCVALLCAGREGRAGMAAVVLKGDRQLDGKRLYRHLVRSLPAYAWPWFLRIQVSGAFSRPGDIHAVRFNSSCLQSSLDVTETFKQQKTKLVQEAFNPHATQDALYFLHAPQEDYIPLTASLHHSIMSGQIHL